MTLEQTWWTLRDGSPVLARLSRNATDMSDARPDTSSVVQECLAELLERGLYYNPGELRRLCPAVKRLLGQSQETQLSVLRMLFPLLESDELSHPTLLRLKNFAVLLLDEELPFEASDVTLVALHLAGRRLASSGDALLLKFIQKQASRLSVEPETIRALRVVHQTWDGSREGRQLRDFLDSLQPDAGERDVTWVLSRMLDLRDAWASLAARQIAEMPEPEAAAYLRILTHSASAQAAQPSKSWTRTGATLLAELDATSFVGRLCEWFDAVDQPRANGGAYLDPDNNVVLKGLCWLAGMLEDVQLARALGRLAASAYKKHPKVGPRAVAVGNAAVYGLSAMPSDVAVGQLAMLKIKVKAGSAQKGIEKALTAAAERLQIPREEIEEMAVPSYGLTDVGVREERFGDFTARLVVDHRGKGELTWLKAGGKTQKSIPAAVKADFPEELKDLKGDVKDVEAMIPAQRDRIDNLFLQRKVWPFPVWRERYLDHPVVGVIARRLIWRFTAGDRAVDGIWHDGQIVDAEGEALSSRYPEFDDPSLNLSVELWHPVGQPMDDVPTWRGWLERHEISQPFKQAHREVYLLTDAERRTNTYSNRFAAHVLRQHQFHALCGVRGWKNKLRLLVDDIYAPPLKLLPQWGLRAEFWIEGIGDQWGRDTTESGSFSYLSTDQVRFYRIAADQRYAHAFGGGYEIHGQEHPANEPLPLDLIPPLVLSEILRDVDLFVGVCSVGNDPTWADGGPEGRYANYWQNFSFGDLSVSAKTRKEVLERLIPRLKIAPRCSFEEKFLKVRGDLRTYKIHLGSGNILMEPNDQYLCIVPDGRMEKGGDGMFLPFEGDRTMSIILSKAMLLADDRKITDPTITRQIEV
jgi:hypothetical protein